MNAISMKQESIDVLWKATLAVAAVMLFAVVPFEAMASGTNAFETVMCNIVALFTGPMGKAIATLALIIVGLGALMGKVSWGMALIVAIGVALVFGAASVVDAIAGQSGAGGTCTAGSVITP